MEVYRAGQICINGFMSSFPVLASAMSYELFEWMAANVLGWIRHLKPGYGSFEQVELDMEPRCDDGTLPEDSSLVQWWQYLVDATQRVNRPLAYNHWTGHMLQQAGFVDIQETVIRAPLNSWPADPHQKDIGRWYNLGMTEGLEALSLAPLTRVSKWHLDDVKRIVRDVKKVMCNKKIHAYNNM